MHYFMNNIQDLETAKRVAGWSELQELITLPPALWVRGGRRLSQAVARRF